MRGGAFFNGKEGRDDFRKTAPSRAVTSLALLERARAWEWVKDPPLRKRGTGESKQNLRYEHRRKKADFMRRFKASRERKAEYIAQMEKRMRDDYRRRTGKEAESFCVL